MSNCVDKLEAIFKDLMTEETVPVRERTKANCAHWDSLMQLGLVTSIEQEFDITLSDADALDMNSFEAAVTIVSEKIAAKNS